MPEARAITRVSGVEEHLVSRILGELVTDLPAEVVPRPARWMELWTGMEAADRAD
jgi:hypothetical protein